MKKVVFNVSFKDRYTGKMNVAGKTAEISEERVAEIKEVNPNFITVIGSVPEETQGMTNQSDDKKSDDKKSDDKKSDDEKSDDKKSDDEKSDDKKGQKTADK